MKSFNFSSTHKLNCSSPVKVPASVVGENSVDKDGFIIEGAQAPVFANKQTPFSIEFSHKVPTMAYPSMNDYFEVEDVWEESNVFAGRSTLRNLARCFLFPVEDYYCREFVIDAGFVQGKLFLQRHPDDALQHQEEGYGIVFERAVTKGAHPESKSYNQFLSYPIGEHNMMVRCEVDCVDAKTQQPIGVTTKKVKRKKNGQGYYPMGPPSYFAEQWLQMVLSGTSVLVIGARDEGPQDTGRANIVSMTSCSVEKAATNGELSPARQQQVFDGLSAALTWIKQCFQQAIASKTESVDQLAQAQIRFTTGGGSRKELVFVPVRKSEHVEMVSENVIQGINEFAK